jgi:VIT1/CCC1 family predicted Fe2+/Mn2+ transporter
MFNIVKNLITGLIALSIITLFILAIDFSVLALISTGIPIVMWVLLILFIVGLIWFAYILGRDFREAYT